jgi:hypothetical protein
MIGETIKMREKNYQNRMNNVRISLPISLSLFKGEIRESSLNYYKIPELIPTLLFGREGLINRSN